MKKYEEERLRRKYKRQRNDIKRNKEILKEFSAYTQKILKELKGLYVKK
tara:strand:+ start:375 stop:521 length:147 start_codon:yes stop_codon:yes gene_type:complete